MERLSRIIDISPVISARIGVWPGDVAFRRDVSLSFADGANIELSAIHTTVHLGAHTDAPSHYLTDGVGIDARDLSLYMGQCQVVCASTPRGERIQLSHVKTPIHAPRVLFRTGSFPDPDTFNEDFSSLSPDLIDALAKQGVRLVGIDTPSIDPLNSKELPSHAAVARNDMAILEGIVLDHVEEGTYTLVALPLRLEHGDASPVRAVLVDDQ